MKNVYTKTWAQIDNGHAPLRVCFIIAILIEYLYLLICFEEGNTIIEAHFVQD